MTLAWYEHLKYSDNKKIVGFGILSIIIISCYEQNGDWNGVSSYGRLFCIQKVSVVLFWIKQFRISDVIFKSID